MDKLHNMDADMEVIMCIMPEKGISAHKNCL